MRVRLRNPDHDVESDGGRTVRDVLAEPGERLTPSEDADMPRGLSEEVLPAEIYDRGRA